MSSPFNFFNPSIFQFFNFTILPLNVLFNVVVQVVERLNLMQLCHGDGYLVVHLQQGYHINQTQTVEAQGFLDVSLWSDVTYFYFKLASEQLVNLLNNLISCHRCFNL